jgi:uridine kinase
MLQELRQITGDWRFLLGLTLRILLVCTVLPWTIRDWFAPFIDGTTTFPSIDPWGSFLAHGGDKLAFPYGPIMYVLFFIPALLGTALTSLAGTSSITPLMFGVTVLAIEFATMCTLVALSREDRKEVAWFFWLSPLAIYVSYWYGQLDIVPVFFLVGTFLLLKNARALYAGVALGLGVSAKLSVFLAAPFFLVYLWRNSRQRALFKPFLTGLTSVTLVGAGLVALLPGYREMVLGSRELAKVCNFALDLGGDTHIFLMPVVYALLLYSAWRIERMSFELFFVFVGIAFFSVLLFTPASTGWFLWSLPFVAFIQSRAGGTTALLGIAFSCLFVLTGLLRATGAEIVPLNFDLTAPVLHQAASTHIQFLYSLLLSATWTSGVLFCLQMFIHGVRRNDFFRLSRRPLAVGIAGDSGTGKDTFASSIAGLFGHDSTTLISGDDYHRWDRSAPMWKMITHLDPRGNDLGRFTRDVLVLLDGKPVTSRHYDHQTGRFRRAASVAKNDVVVVSGLHTLLIDSVRQQLDLSVYLDMDEALRTFFKVRRDVNQRGRPLEYVLDSISKRLPDADMFVKPQSQRADIVFSLGVADPLNIERCVAKNDYRLNVTMRAGVSAEALVHTLIGLCGMHVESSPLGQDGLVTMSIEGELGQEDVALAAEKLRPVMDDLLAWRPRWESGMLGVMQLVFLSHVYHVLQRRLSYA